jgi:hypothetical protein
MPGAGYIGRIVWDVIVSVVMAGLDPAIPLR